MLDTSEVLINVKEPLAWVTLNRPRTLNSLTLPMVEILGQHLHEWAQDPSVQAVIVQGQGERAFCSGGNLRAVYEAVAKQDYTYPEKFFRHEYIMNHRLQAFPKPYISLIDGIAMGGGLGLSVHGQFRVVTSHALLAMPETNLGFFPDVGGAYFLNCCPGALGLYIALTGVHFNAADAFYARIATHYIKREKLPQLCHLFEEQASLPPEWIERTLDEFSDPCPLSTFEKNQDLIDRCFSHESVQEIITALKQETSDFAQETLALIQKRSPTSLIATYEYMKRAQSLSFKEVMRMDFQLAQRFVRLPDFKEGLRATIIDKDHQPCWNPALLDKVDLARIKSFFEIALPNTLEI